MRITSFPIFLVCVLLVSCERSRLQPAEELQNHPTHVLPERFFLDPQLPMEMCWQQQEASVSFRLQCWHERLPELSCQELRALEDMAFQAAQTLGSSLRRVFERGWSEQVRVMPDGQSRLREVLWDGPVLSLRLTELRGVSAEPILQDFELQRRGLKSWQPWLSLEGEDLQGWSSMADFLTCAPL